MSDAASIARTIHESFGDTALIGDDALAIFGNSHHPEIWAFMEMIGGKDWQGFLHVLETSDEAQTYGHMYNFMTPQAYHYFAPALLIFSMNEKSDVLGGDFLRSLLPASTEKHQQYIQESLRLFSDQRIAQALLVSSMQEKPDVLGEDFLRSLALLPAVPEGLQQHTEERLSLFSEPQKHAIALVVDYFYRLYGVDMQREADLVAYWAKWLA
jgi:hypothetical protein